MRFLQKVKDGGPESPVDAYVLIEIKGLFSVMLLKFNKGGREAFHSHAFDALTWFIKGDLVEQSLVNHPNGTHQRRVYRRSLLPKVTPRSLLHRVVAHKDSWCLTLRGPWVKQWVEYNEDDRKFTLLTRGRRVRFSRIMNCRDAAQLAEDYSRL